MHDSNLKPYVTILILIDGFLQYGDIEYYTYTYGGVTILILIDGFLQYAQPSNIQTIEGGHNPYFNRWFSAIKKMHLEPMSDDDVTILILIDGFLQ